jgi:hypothetical protein
MTDDTAAALLSAESLGATPHFMQYEAMVPQTMISTAVTLTTTASAGVVTEMAVAETVTIETFTTITNLPTPVPNPTLNKPVGFTGLFFR